jgi:hypothetical protein
MKKTIKTIALLAALGFSAAYATQEKIIDHEVKKLNNFKKYIRDITFKKGFKESLNPYLTGNLINYKLIKKYECHVIRLKFGRIIKPIFIEQELELPKNLDDDFFKNGDAARVLADIDDVIHAMMKINALTENQAKTVFNLDCSGGAGIGVANNFEINGETLTILGDVESGFYENFSGIINKNPQIKTIIIGSGGGLVYEAMKAGRLIRQRKITTYLGNDCYSACTLLFMGGMNRNIAGPYPRLGFHQAYNTFKLKGGTEKVVAIPKTSQTYTDIGIYAIEMNINPRWLYEKMFAADPNGMNYLNTNDEKDAREICASNYATWIKIWMCHN